MLAGKVVLITGGASGLGRTMVEMMAAAGAKVFFSYRSSQQQAEVLCKTYGENVGACQADASDYRAAENSVQRCIEQFGKIDVLVNNAYSARDTSLLNSNPENFDYTIRNVLYPVYNYTKAIAEHFVQRQSGRIINIGSINGMRGREGSVAYSAAKAGVEGFSKTVAKELGRFNINCNVVAPGFINTEGQKNTSEIMKKLVLDECAIKRLSEPDDIVHMVIFLASDQAQNITGQVYQVDCGQYI